MRVLITRISGRRKERVRSPVKNTPALFKFQVSETKTPDAEEKRDEVKLEGMRSKGEGEGGREGLTRKGLQVLKGLERKLRGMEVK